MADREFLVRLTRELMDQGKLIEAGWVSFRMHAIPLNAPADQLQEMRLAFMAGAQHLLSSIMAGLDPDAEPTEADERRLDLIDAELEAFAQELKLRIVKPEGKG